MVNSHVNSHGQQDMLDHASVDLTCSDLTHLSSILKGQPCTHVLPGGKFIADPGRKPVPGLDGPQREVHDGNLLARQAPPAAVDEVQPDIRIVPAGTMHR